MPGNLQHASVGPRLSQVEWEAAGAHLLAAQATGDIVFASTAAQLSGLAIGAVNTTLQSVAGIPAWVASPTFAGATFTADVVMSGAAIRWTVGVAVVAGEYSIQRNLDGPDRLQSNVPTGAVHEFSVNDVQVMSVALNAVLIGPNPQSGALVEIGRDQNAASPLLRVSNVTAGTLARAQITFEASGLTGIIGLANGGFTPVGNILADMMYVQSAATAANGLLLESLAGNVAVVSTGGNSVTLASASGNVTIIGGNAVILQRVATPHLRIGLVSGVVELPAGIELEMNDAIHWDTDVAVTAGRAEITRVGSNLNYNVAVGQLHLFRINDISVFSIDADTISTARAFRFTADDTITAAQAEIARVASDLHYNVSAGNIHSWRINDVEEMVLSATQLSLNGNTLATVGTFDHDGPNLGFYGTAPIAQQVGVAVTAAGIHAACVALGLFTA